MPECAITNNPSYEACRHDNVLYKKAPSTHCHMLLSFYILSLHVASMPRLEYKTFGNWPGFQCSDWPIYRFWQENLNYRPIRIQCLLEGVWLAIHALETRSIWCCFILHSSNMGVVVYDKHYYIKHCVEGWEHHGRLPGPAARRERMTMHSLSRLYRWNCF